MRLPDNAGDGVHLFSEKNDPGGVSTDVDVYFYAADCRTRLGRAATGAADEAGPVPAGTKWAQLVLYAGSTPGITVRVETTLERVTGPAKALVGGVHIRRPTGGSRLPATGVGSNDWLALLAIAAAVFVRRWVARAV